METITTDRLILRKATETDKFSDSLISLLHDEKVKKYIPSLYCEDEITRIIHYSRDLCDYNDDYCYLIEDLYSGDIIGILEAYVESENIISLSAAISEYFRGNGFITEALKAFLLFIQNTQPHIIAAEFLINEDNESSLRTMDKLNIPLSKDLVTHLCYRLPLYEELPF